MKVSEIIAQLKEQRFYGELKISFKAGMPYKIYTDKSLEMETYEDSYQSIEKRNLKKPN